MSITYAELGIFKGAPVLGGSATLTRLGTVNVAAVINSQGIKNTQITATVAVGDDLWAVFASSATTPAQFRSTIADELQIGIVQSISGRPSTIASPTAWTLGGATLLVPWFVWSLGSSANFCPATPSGMIMLPVGVAEPINALAVTALVTATSYAIYLGRAVVAVPAVNLLYKVTTQAA